MRALFQSHEEPGSRSNVEEKPAAHSATLRRAGLVSRTLLLILLLLMAARVSAPQHLGSTWYDIPPGDFLRGVAGAAFCVWMLVELFIVPKDAASYRTWLYLGLVLFPLGLICLVAIW
jgi:membrane protein YdbS with pleckstrin-like domain